MICIYAVRNSPERFENTRHNAGAFVLKIWLSKFHTYEYEILGNVLVYRVRSELGQAIFGFSKGYMNESGLGAFELVSRGLTRLPELCVIQDDMDLDLGRLKLSFNGGSGGHKGINSVIKAVGSNEFWRLKVGISKPEVKEERPDWLLEKFSHQEAETIRSAADQAFNGMMEIIKGNFSKAQNLINRKTQIKPRNSKSVHH